MWLEMFVHEVKVSVDTFDNIALLLGYATLFQLLCFLLNNFYNLKAFMPAKWKFVPHPDLNHMSLVGF